MNSAAATCVRCGQAWDRATGIHVSMWHFGVLFAYHSVPVCAGCIRPELFRALERASTSALPDFDPIRAYILNETAREVAADGTS